jgi:hypothetical protein
MPEDSSIENGTLDQIGDTPMRVRPKPIGCYAWYLWPFFWNQRRKYGRILDAALSGGYSFAK